MQALSRWISVTSLMMAAGALSLACGSKGTDDEAGGSTGNPSGGGGASATGGSTNSAGAPTAGSGTAGTGTAGTAPGGGAPGGGAPSGGAPGTGGGTGGAPAAGGAAAIAKTYAFDTTVETWKIQYTSSGPLMAGSAGSGGAGGGGGAGGSGGAGGAPTAPLIATTDPALTVTWTGTDGNPATPAGALQVGIPYASASQYVGVGVSLPIKVDLTGRILRANVKLVSGLGSAADLLTNPGGAKLYIKTGAAYVYAAGTFTNVPAIGTWIPIEFDIEDPSYIDPANAAAFDKADVREIGIQLDSSGTSKTAMPAVFLIDSVSY